MSPSGRSPRAARSLLASPPQPPASRIKGIAKSVTNEVGAQDDDDKYSRREQKHPWERGGRTGAGADKSSQRDVGWLHTEPKEAQARLGHDRGTDAQCGVDDEDRCDIRQDVANENPPSRH